MLNNNTSLQFYREDFCVEEAKSSRSSCKGCEKIINEGDLRIGHSIIFDPHAEFLNKQWYHLECVKLPSRHSDLILEDIEGIEEISLADCKKIKKKLGIIDEAEGGKKKEKPKIKHLTHYERVDLSKLKPKDMKAFNSSQLSSFKKLIKEFSSKKIPELKELLVKNHQRSSGDKLKLATRIAQMKVLGSIPSCPGCGGSNIKFDIVKDEFFCPGYLDDVDWVNCQRKFAASEVPRGKFED